MRLDRNWLSGGVGAVQPALVCDVQRERVRDRDRMIAAKSRRDARDSFGLTIDEIDSGDGRSTGRR